MLNLTFECFRSLIMALGDVKQDLTQLLRAGGYDDANAAYSSVIADASKEVQRRIRALKKYQLQSIELESKFYSRVHELEAEFEPLFNSISEEVNFFFNL